MLTESHKKNLIGAALTFLTCYYSEEGDEFLSSIVTGDEMWVFHHTTESKQSMEWCHTYCPMDKKFKPSPSTKKILANVFETKRGFWLILCQMGSP
jgi:hypothetical protein